MSQYTHIKRVLVVDDDRNFQELICIYLTKQGYEVLCADNGVDAISILNNQDVHALITEWMLSTLDGAGLLGWIRQEVKQSFPVLVLTAQEKRVEDRVREAGADAILYKPAKGADILQTLQELLHPAPFTGTGLRAPTPCYND